MITGGSSISISSYWELCLVTSVSDLTSETDRQRGVTGKNNAFPGSVSLRLPRGLHCLSLLRLQSLRVTALRHPRLDPAWCQGCSGRLVASEFLVLLFVVFVLLFHILATSEVIIKMGTDLWQYTLVVTLGKIGCTMTQYPTQSHYLGTVLTSPGPILVMPTAMLDRQVSIL